LSGLSRRLGFLKSDAKLGIFIDIAKFNLIFFDFFCSGLCQMLKNE